MLNLSSALYILFLFFLLNQQLCKKKAKVQNSHKWEKTKWKSILVTVETYPRPCFSKVLNWGIIYFIVINLSMYFFYIEHNYWKPEA